MGDRIVTAIDIVEEQEALTQEAAEVRCPDLISIYIQCCRFRVLQSNIIPVVGRFAFLGLACLN
jgi:hypothetical protein